MWLTETDWHHHHGRVQFDGKWIPREEWHRLEEERAGLLERTAAESAIKSAAKRRVDPSVAEAAIAEFRELPESLRRYTLAKSLESPSSRCRQLAVRLTAELDGNNRVILRTASPDFGG